MDSVKASISIALVGGIALMFAFAANAAKIDDDIAIEQLLASRCAAGGGPAGTSRQSCDARDLAIKELEKQGWCRSRGEQWRKCHPGALATHDQGASVNPSAVRVFVVTRAGEPGFHTGSIVRPIGWRAALH